MYEWRSILNKASKPSHDELNTTLKVVGLGAIIIGALAYLVRLLAVLFLFT
jgi:preprotein translocase subunit Sss1